MKKHIDKNELRRLLIEGKIGSRKAAKLYLEQFPDLNEWPEL